MRWYSFPETKSELMNFWKIWSIPNRMNAIRVEFGRRGKPENVTKATYTAKEKLIDRQRQSEDSQICESTQTPFFQGLRSHRKKSCLRNRKQTVRSSKNFVSQCMAPIQSLWSPKQGTPSNRAALSKGGTLYRINIFSVWNLWIMNWGERGSRAAEGSGQDKAFK